MTSSTLAEERESRVLKRPWIFEKSWLGDVLHFSKDRVEVLLRSHDDPRPALTDRAQLLGNRLEIQHEVGICSDELPYLVDEEHQSMSVATPVEVLLHPLREVLDGYGEVPLGIVDPLLCRLLGLIERLTERCDDLVSVELPSVPLIEPRGLRLTLEDFVKDPQTPLLREVSLHMCDVRMIPAESFLLVENSQKDPEEGITSRGVIRLAVDVEEDRLDGRVDDPLQISVEGRISELLFEELDPTLPFAIVDVLGVLEEVGEDLDEVRLTAAKEA